MWLNEILQPPPDPALNRWIEVIRWQIEICDGNRCAAAILAYFLARHAGKLKHQTEGREDNKIAEAHGLQKRRGAESLWFRFTDEQIEDAIFFYKRRTFPDAIKILEDKGFVSILRENPNPKFSFDKSRYARLNPAAIEQELRERFDYNLPEKSASGKSAESSAQERGSRRKIADSNKQSSTNNKRERKSRKSPETLLPEEMRHLSDDLVAIAEAEIAKFEEVVEPATGWPVWIKRRHHNFVNHADTNERTARKWSSAFRNWISKSIEIQIEEGSLKVAAEKGGAKYAKDRRDNQKPHANGAGTHAGGGGKYSRAAREHAQHFGSASKEVSDSKNPVR